MDIDRIKAMAENPKRTRKELEQMRTNALLLGEHRVVKLVETVLRRRFPKTWPPPVQHKANKDQGKRNRPKVADSVVPEKPTHMIWRFGYWTKYRR